MNTKNGIRGYEVIVEQGRVEDWKKLISSSVSKSIMSNEKEILRRKEQAKSTITAWAVSDIGRKKSSETAVKTSSRPEIIENRSNNLKNWRINNPEDFYNKCTSKCQKFMTKPERILYEECLKIDKSFNRNQRIWNAKFTTISKRRQIDILHKEKLIAIEFDGIYHFKNIKKGQNLENTRSKDNELNEVLSSIGYAVIRVSYEDYDHKQGGKFSQRAINMIKLLVDNPIPGVYKIGESYA